LPTDAIRSYRARSFLREVNLVKSRSTLLVFVFLLSNTGYAQTQLSRSKLAGMWSDPPATAEAAFCSFSCTDVGIERLNKLLDDPANDALPASKLMADAKTYERSYLRDRLTPAALKGYPLDPLQDPGYLRCEPWGLMRQMFAPHQLELRQRDKDRIELRYGEWAAVRTIHMDGSKIPQNLKPTPLGYSVGRWESDVLVIETTAVQSNIANWPDGNGAATHSDQLRVIERYARSADGKTLLLTATLEDPWSLREPIVLKKVWRWAPDQKITPYDSCERPTSAQKGTKR
jgi:hypothetical protein